MKNRSIAQIILVNFFKTIGIIMLLLGVGVLSYYLTMLFLKQIQRVERSTQYEHVMDVNPGSMESSNLIYSYDKKSGEIEAMVLELFDAGTKNMTYITIPVNTQITISGKAYGELLEKSPMLPQVVKMSAVNSYFSGDVAYEYGILILQEELQAEIGYFTAMTSDVFEKYFEKENGKKLIYRPTKTLLDEAAQCKTEDEMNDYMESKWDNLISNITLSQKQHHAKELKDVNREMIRTFRIRGKESNGVFKLDKSKNAEFIEGLWEKKAYQKPQKKVEGDTATSSANVGSIWIYNGSKITGLAAEYQKRLEKDGFDVKDVSNATGGVRTRTVIYVKKKKAANALKKYFNDPSVEVTENLSSGAEIEIILGTKDKLSSDNHTN